MKCYELIIIKLIFINQPNKLCNAFNIQYATYINILCDLRFHVTQSLKLFFCMHKFSIACAYTQTWVGSMC